MRRRSWTRRIDITEPVAILKFCDRSPDFSARPDHFKIFRHFGGKKKSGSPSSSSHPMTLRVYIFINQLSYFWNSNLKYANYTAVVSIARPPLKKEKYLENRG